MQFWHIKDPIPYLSESPNDDPMVVRRLELQETVEKLPEIVFRVNLVLENHLEHGAAEVEVGVVGVLLHRHALTADAAEPLDGPQTPYVGVGVGVARCRGGVGGGSGGGGGVVVWVIGGCFGLWLWFGVEDVGQPWPATAAA